MKIATNITSFNNNYIEPIRKNAVVQWTFSACVETIKIVAATCFLVLLATQVRPTSKLSTKHIAEAVIVAPLVEEILFRGIFLRGIRLAQYLVQKDPTSNEEKLAKQKFRVRFTGIAFGLAHFHGGLFQVTQAALGGISYGYLSEKYETLSASMITHGIHNFIVLKAKSALTQTAPSVLKTCGYLLCLIVYEIGVYRLATRKIEPKKHIAVLDPATGG